MGSRLRRFVLLRLGLLGRALGLGRWFGLGLRRFLLHRRDDHPFPGLAFSLNELVRSLGGG
jgi:hypothetical protein